MQAPTEEMVSGFFQHFFLKYFNRFGFSFRFPIYVFFFRWIPVLSTYYFKHIWLKTNETKEPGWIYSVATTTSNKYRYRIYFRNNDSPHVDERNKKNETIVYISKRKTFRFFLYFFRCLVKVAELNLHIFWFRLCGLRESGRTMQ